MSSANDDFAGTGALSANWNVNLGVCARVSGSAVASIAEADVMWNANSWSPDVIVGARHFDNNPPNVRYQLPARFTTGLLSTANGYTMQMRGDDTLKIVRFDAGAGTVLESVANASWATDDLFELRVVGTNLRMYKNGVALGSGATDATYSAAGLSGFILASTGDIINAWQCSDISGIRQRTSLAQLGTRAGTRVPSFL